MCGRRGGQSTWQMLGSHTWPHRLLVDAAVPTGPTERRDRPWPRRLQEASFDSLVIVMHINVRAQRTPRAVHRQTLAGQRGRYFAERLLDDFTFEDGSRILLLPQLPELESGGIDANGCVAPHLVGRAHASGWCAAPHAVTTVQFEAARRV